MAKSSKKRKPIHKNKIKGKGKHKQFDRQQWLILLGIFVFGFILYANTIGHDFVLDDDIITRKNVFVNNGFSGLKDIFTHGYLYGFNGENDQSYRPLVLANMAIETQIFGANAKVHHFFNVLIYGLSCCFLFLFLAKIFRKYSIWLPLCISLLFVAHPIHTEVVANIKSRDEILSFLFGVMSLWFLMKYSISSRPRQLVIALLCYFLCILSKETGLAVLGLVPFTLYFFTEKSLKRIALSSLAFAAVAAFYFIIRAAVMDSMTFAEDMDIINNSLLAAESSMQRLATNVSVMGRYIFLLFFPHPLSYDYSFNHIPNIGLGDVRFLLSMLAYIGLIIIAVRGLKTKNPISYGIIFFAIMLILVSNFLTMVGATMAERFIYSSSLGFCIIIGYLLVKAFKVEQSGWKGISKPFVVILGCILLLYSIKTITRNQDWKNSETLYSSGLKTAPNSARVHNHYASHFRMILENNPNHPKGASMASTAIKHYNKSLEILPEYSEASYNLGVLHYTMGKPQLALQAYQKTLQSEPNHLSALNNLGVIYFNNRNYNEAMKYWNRLLETDPENVQALGNVGAIHHNQGNFLKAKEFFEKALAIDPSDPNTLNKMIASLKRLGQTQQAQIYQERLRNLNR